MHKEQNVSRVEGAAQRAEQRATASQAGGTQHSQLPWRYDVDEHGASRRMALVITPDGSMAIDCTNSAPTYAGDCANAAFIVTACNAHHELMALARQYRDDMRYLPMGGSRLRRIEAIEAVLAKAEAR